MPLYTKEERLRRDASPWTLVQGVLAPIQFLVFITSAALVLRFLITGDGFEAATISVVIKTLVLYTIMITGCIWERQVFGRYLFASAFFWEDFVSMFVLALHTAYLAALVFGSIHARYQMYIALLAYSAYLLNATQFLLKLRAARLEGERKAGLGESHNAPIPRLEPAPASNNVRAAALNHVPAPVANHAPAANPGLAT
jgi:3-vinyl bacteriochlorophyllide hydratase